MSYQRLAIACALAASLGSAGCASHGAHTAGPPPLNVDVATAQRQDISVYMHFDGQIAPLEQSTLSFQQSGPITKINVNIGDVVQAGELLARIDPSTLQAQYAQAEASAQGAQIGLPVTVQNTAAALQTAEAAMKNAQLVYTQNEQLYKQGYVSEQTLENARAAYVQAQSQYASAKANLGNNQVTAESVKASEAQARTLRTELSQTSLYAPYEGVITARDMDPGSMAGPSSPVLSIARVDAVWVNINIADTDLPFARPGKSASFTTTSLPGKTFTGKIQTVNAVPAQGTVSYLARWRQPNPGALLRGGMPVWATVLQARHRNAIVVPRSALAQDDTGTSVYIVVNGPNGTEKAQKVPVKVGLQTDTDSEVVSEKITAGTQVITTRPDALQDGSPITIDGAPSASPGAAATGSADPAGAPAPAGSAAAPPGTSSTTQRSAGAARSRGGTNH